MLLESHNITSQLIYPPDRIFPSEFTFFSSEGWSSSASGTFPPFLCLMVVMMTVTLLFFSLTPRWTHKQNASSYPNIQLLLYKMSENRTASYAIRDFKLQNCNWVEVYLTKYNNSILSLFPFNNSDIKLHLPLNKLHSFIKWNYPKSAKIPVHNLAYSWQGFSECFIVLAALTFGFLTQNTHQALLLWKLRRVSLSQKKKK